MTAHSISCTISPTSWTRSHFAWPFGTAPSKIPQKRPEADDEPVTRRKAMWASSFIFVNFLFDFSWSVHVRDQNIELLWHNISSCSRPSLHGLAGTHIPTAVFGWTTKTSCWLFPPFVRMLRFLHRNALTISHHCKARKSCAVDVAKPPHPCAWIQWEHSLILFQCRRSDYTRPGILDALFVWGCGWLRGHDSGACVGLEYLFCQAAIWRRMSGSFESLKSIQFVGEGFYALFLDGLRRL